MIISKTKIFIYPLTIGLACAHIHASDSPQKLHNPYSPILFMKNHPVTTTSAAFLNGIGGAFYIAGLGISRGGDYGRLFSDMNKGAGALFALCGCSLFSLHYALHCHTIKKRQKTLQYHPTDITNLLTHNINNTKQQE